MIHEGWAEFTAAETGQYIGSLVESAMADVRAEKDQVIEAKERENELLRERIDDLVQPSDSQAAA